MSRAIFVTGTDTGVGKTLIASALCFKFQQQGLRVAAFKPLQSGGVWQGGQLVSSDAHHLQAAVGNQQPLDSIAPFRFEQELAPSVILEQQQQELDPAVLIKHYRQLAHEHDVVVIEGVGGIQVPICGDFFTIDLIKELNAEVLVVARNALGTINHSLLTLHYLRSHAVEPIGVVFSQSNLTDDSSRATNPSLVERYGKVKVLGEVPFLQQAQAACVYNLDTLKQVVARLYII